MGRPGKSDQPSKRPIRASVQRAANRAVKQEIPEEEEMSDVEEAPPKKPTCSKTEPDEPTFHRKPYDESFCNIVLYLNEAQKGYLSSTNQRRLHQLAVIKDAKSLQAIRMDAVFERRITSLSWHPNISNMLGLASKGGGLMLVNTSSKGNFDIVEQFPGIGPGGSVLALKFHPTINEVFFTASLDGTVCYRNYMTKKVLQYLSTGSYDHWFTSFDMSEETGVMIAGDTKGTITLLSKDGTKVKERKIHKTSKVTHIEFCPRKNWLFVTASLDKMVRLWDLRNFSDKAQALYTLPHEKPINSAHFSRTDCNYLLTTDQHSELRVYQAPYWDLINIIPHPHRQFQHISPIKATWHPLEDIVVCGRYPDPHFPDWTPGELSTVDFMCPTTGQMLYQLHNPSFKGLLSLNSFNNVGNLLATAAGLRSIIWASRPKPIPALCKEKSKKRKREGNEDEDDEEEEEEEEEEEGNTSKYFDSQMPSTSYKVLDSLPVNHRCNRGDAKKKASETKQKGSDTKQKTSSAKQKLSDTTQRASDAKKRASDTKKKASDDQKKTSDDKKKSSGDKKKPSDDKKKPSDDKKKPSDDKKKPSDGSKKARTKK